MRTILLSIILTLMGISNVTAQVDQPAQVDNSAPVVWERYKVSARNISFLFPKMPMVLTTPGVCGEVASVTYLAFAEGIIYEVIIAGPRQSATHVNCGGKIVSYSPRKLEDRLVELRKIDRYKESTIRINGADVVRFTWNKGSRWIFPNNSTAARWTEVAVSHYPNNKPDVGRLLESISTASSEGKEIGSGSPVMIGDKGITSHPIGNELLARTSSPLTLYWRPRWYIPSTIKTENIKGSVILEITFFANGSIGPIRVEKSLPNGLTEIAIATARRISFLPKRVGGMPVDDKQTVEYRLREPD